jgi:hypothetical protein
MMTAMIFLVGVLLGVLAGAMLCVRYLRQEIAADIGPRLRRIEQQLATLETEAYFARTSQLTELTRHAALQPTLPGQS